MKYLNQLIIKYRKTLDRKILSEIFTILQPVIIKKSKYVFYRKLFHKNYRTFYLSELGTIEVEDVKNELRLFILELINKTDIEKPFDKYLYSSIWNWGNSLVELHDSNIREKSKNVDDGYYDNLAVVNPQVNKYNWENMNLNEIERKIVEILKENHHIKQSQLAVLLGVTQARISQIFKVLRQKIKRYL